MPSQLPLSMATLSTKIMVTTALEHYFLQILLRIKAIYILILTVLDFTSKIISLAIILYSAWAGLLNIYALHLTKTHLISYPLLLRSMHIKQNDFLGTIIGNQIVKVTFKLNMSLIESKIR